MKINYHCSRLIGILHYRSLSVVGQGRLRFNNARKNQIFLGIVFNLHYLCPQTKNHIINLLFCRWLRAIGERQKS